MDRFLRETGTLHTKLDNTTGTNVVNILNVDDVLGDITQEFLGWHYRIGFYLEQLTATYYLPSLTRAPFPNVNVEDSSAIKIAAITDIETTYPRVGLKIFRNSNQVARLIFQNHGKELQNSLVYPYLTVNETKLLKSGDSLSCQVYNAGYGLLGTNGDYISIEGDYRIEITLVEKSRISTAPFHFGVTIPQSSTQILPENPYRSSLWLVNGGDSPIWIAFGNSATPGQGILLNPGGSTANFDMKTHFISDALFAIAEGGSSQITGIEASYG